MNDKLRKFEQESGLDVYGKFARSEPWESALEKYAELIVEECSLVVERNLYKNIGWNTSRKIREHFGIVESEE